MKRIICLVLAAVMVLGVLGMVSLSVFATEEAAAVSDTPTGLTTSAECIALLKQHEGFVQYPVWDYAQYTVGFGTRCPDDMLDYYNKNGITEQEAEALLRNFLDEFEREINEKIIKEHGLQLTQNQFDALVSFSYNCGTRWAYSPDGVFYQAIINGATGNDLIRAFALWCSAGGEVLTYLLNRRLSEANMYLNGIYERKPPENYCYVLYNPNGGITSPKTQGYDASVDVAPFPVPTYEGYTFEGWYTERVGGEKVEKLTTAHNGTTLYAHWVDANGNSSFSQEGDVTVTVTGVDVNVRTGPGTNYSKDGKVTKGDKLVITETAHAGGYTWGKFDRGWIALQYTDYDQVILQKPEQDTTQPTEPAPTEPAPTEPVPTEPAPTEPTPTEPDPTEPAPTEPAPTEPAPTEPAPTEPAPTEPAKVYGTINVKEWLRVRKGPGTGYAEVKRLKPNERVEILEQKTVGAVTWARIADGWISMQYVILESNASSGATGSAIGSGTIVNCTRLRIRSGAGTNYSLVGYLNRGDKVSFTEYKKVGSVTWGRINNGWISLDYVQLDGSGSNSGNNSTGGTAVSLTGTVNVNEWLRIRSGPGTSYAVAGYMKPNEKVTITEQKTVGAITWGKTEKGWISMQYVVLDKADGNSSGAAPEATPETNGDVRTVTATSLYIRKTPGTGKGNTIVGYLYNGTKITVLETQTVDGRPWGRINNGWVCLEYTK